LVRNIIFHEYAAIINIFARLKQTPVTITFITFVFGSYSSLLGSLELFPGGALKETAARGRAVAAPRRWLHLL